jgi:hypothetical protein
VLCVQPQREQWAMRQVEVHARRETYSPGWTDTDKQGRERWHPLLPGYVFAFANKLHLERKIVEFARVLPFDRYWVTEDELQAVRELERLGAQTAQPYHPDGPGRRVAFSLHDVPFVGQFIRWRNGGRFAEVLVEALPNTRCMVRVDIPASALKRP